MQKDELDPGRVWLIRGFMSAEECAQQIARSEELGYEAALVGDVVLETVRNNSRVIHEDSAMAADLFQLARQFLPNRVDGLALLGFNERFRFYRYEPGQAFRPHRDGIVKRARVWEQSRLTFMVYLNDQMEGGETRFYTNLATALESGPYLTVRPELGAALVFLHPIWHEGADVRSGRKYVLRTDVMFRGPPVADHIR